MDSEYADVVHALRQVPLQQWLDILVARSDIMQSRVHALQTARVKAAAARMVCDVTQEQLDEAQKKADDVAKVLNPVCVVDECCKAGSIQAAENQVTHEKLRLAVRFLSSCDFSKIS
jgi:hypothetical protein